MHQRGGGQEDMKAWIFANFFHTKAAFFVMSPPQARVTDCTSLGPAILLQLVPAPHFSYQVLLWLLSVWHTLAPVTTMSFWEHRLWRMLCGNAQSTTHTQWENISQGLLPLVPTLLSELTSCHNFLGLPFVLQSAGMTSSSCHHTPPWPRSHCPLAWNAHPSSLATTHLSRVDLSLLCVPIVFHMEFYYRNNCISINCLVVCLSRDWELLEKMNMSSLFFVHFYHNRTKY
jgi:hypothetical protein